jgi:plasmid segregation protein ParM
VVQKDQLTIKKSKRYERSNKPLGKKIAIDVGYGDTKAISEDGLNVLYPSVWAPARDLIEPTSGDGYVVDVTRLQNGQHTINFVGELALQESKTISFTLNREKYLHPSHDILLLTAAALLAEKNLGLITLGIGLPIDCYRSQAEALVTHVKNIRATVKVNGQKPVEVYFDKVTAYLQGVTPLLCIKDKPANGFIALCDPGFKTTDYTVFDMRNGKPHLISDMSGSVNIGVSQVNETISREFNGITGGGVLDSWLVRKLIRNGKILYNGSEYDLSDTMADASKNTARSIADKIMESWREMSKFITRTYIIGGVDMLPDLPGMMPDAKVVDEPRFANANAFLEVLCGQSNS